MGCLCSCMLAKWSRDEALAFSSTAIKAAHLRYCLRTWVDRSG
jgi:hypothetical protein